MRKKKILFTYGHARSPIDWGLFGEILKRLLDNSENEVYFLDCMGQFKGKCWHSTYSRFGYCNKCSENCHKIADIAGLKKENILKIENIKVNKIPKFNSLKSALDFTYKGYNLGLSPVSSLMTITRDYGFDIKKWDKRLSDVIKIECIILENVIKYNKIYHFDEIHAFTGRTPLTYPLVSYANKNKINYYVYEIGAKIDRLWVLNNTIPHDFNMHKAEIKALWLNNKPDKVNLAQKWFKERRSGKFHEMEAYTKDQIKNLLPKGFDFNKENIVFFNSSIDEIYAFDCWKHPFVENENVLIKEILEHYKNDNSKHFYLRIHPNLTKAKKNNTTQIREINLLKNKYNNLTIIEPDEKIDTYALLDNASKVLTTYSTIGCEATFWGAVSIIAGKSVYEELDCVYQAKSFEELFKLIDDKNLKPKPKENTYPFGYRNEVFGDKFIYYKIKNLNEGEFLNLKFEKGKIINAK